MNRTINHCPWCNQIGDNGLCGNCTQNIEILKGLSNEELDALPYGIITVDQQGTVIHYSRQEQELSGKRDSDVKGKNFFTEVAPCTAVKEFQGRFQSFLQLRRRRNLKNLTLTFHFPVVKQKCISCS